MSKQVRAFNEHPIDNKNIAIRINHGTSTFNFPPHYHKEVEILLMNQGSLALDVDHQKYYINDGDLLIIGANHIHSYMPSDKNEADFYMLFIDWSTFDALYKDRHTYTLLHETLSQVHLITATNSPDICAHTKQILEVMWEESTSNNRAVELVLTSQVYTLLSKLIRFWPDTTLVVDTKTLLKERKFLKMLNDHIFSHYSEGIDLSSAAFATGYSTYHFTRLIKKYTGFTFKKYLTNFQIAMVKEDLYNDDLSITDIAYRNGYHSPKTFNRIFKNEVGLSPSEFKKAINEV